MKALRYLLGAFAALALSSGGAAAQTPAPSPTPPPTAFFAHAHASVTFADAARTLGMTARLAIAQSASLVRTDVSGTFTQGLPIPPFAMTVVVDRRASTVTLWSDATRTYWRYVIRPGTRPALPRPSPSPGATPRPRATPALGLLDLFELTIRLTGHGDVVGLPATAFSFDLQTRKKGESAPFRLSGATQLADEFLVPVTLDATIEPGVMPVHGTIAYAVDDFARTVPPGLSFDVPAGYTQTSNILEVILHPPARPRPRARR